MRTSAFLGSLSGRLLVLGVLPTLVAIGAIVATSALDDYRRMRRAEERLLDVSVDAAADEVSVHNERWNDLTRAMASAQVDGLFGRRGASLAFSKSVASSSPLILGAYVVYEPDADGRDAASLAGAELPPGTLDAGGRFVPYWYVDSGPGGDGTLKLKPNTDMETLEYYVAPKTGFARTGGAAPTLTEPYLYEGVRMVSHTYPIVLNGRFVGITGIDRSLDMVSRIAEGIRARLGTDVFVVSAGGRIIATTTDAAGGAKEVGQLGFQELLQSPYGPLAGRWRATNEGGEVFEAVDPVLDEPCFYATCPVRTGGWSVIVRRTKADAMRSAKAGLVRSILIGCAGSALIGTLLLLLFRSIGRRVRTAAAAADRIARGDLTQPIPAADGGDETGALLRSMGSMHGNLNALVGSVRSAGAGLGSVALEIAGASEREEASASALGAAAAQIAAAVTELSSTGRELARTMDGVSANATKTAEVASAGRAGLEAMETSMRELARATGSIDEKLGTIRERSETITKVVGTITRIADRTNLLSINAAIESEKAGTFGAGFRVISEEIGRLADETAQATLDIETMVEQMQAAVTSGVAEMSRYTEQMGRGVQDVAAAGSQLAQVIERVNRGSAGIGQVNEGMQAQTVGVQQISEAMASLTGTAQQSMASVKELAHVSADLRSAIGVLREAVARFQLVE